MNTRRADIVDAVRISSSHTISQKNNHEKGFFLLLFAVFVVVDLLALLVGAHSYGSLTEMQSKNDQVIMTSGPIVSSVRASDAKGGIAAGNGPEGRSLVLIEQDNIGTYETRIYLFQGHIVQEYALGGAPYTPERATVLSESDTFSFSFADGLLSIQTDAGVSQVALRNMQGGE